MKNIGAVIHVIAILLVCTMLTGCLQDIFAVGQDYDPDEAEPVVEEPEAPEQQIDFNPDAALRAIYAHFEGHISVRMSFNHFKEVAGIDEFPATRLYARHSNPRGGLTDVVIIRPQFASAGEVREILYRYRDRRIAEFENFDILGSLEIVRTAVVFEHGEYLILLMTADNDEAQIIINRYMPL